MEVEVCTLSCPASITTRSCHPKAGYLAFLSAALLSAAFGMMAALLVIGAGRRPATCVAPLPGDVSIELPGKIGFWTLPGILDGFPPDVVARTYGIGTNDTLPIGQLVSILREALSYPSEENATETREFIDFLTVGRAGSVVCSSYEQDGAVYFKEWRPYRWTRGWHYKVLDVCTSDGWTGFGKDPTVSLTITQKGKYMAVQQINEEIAIASRSTHVGRIDASELQQCCFPATESVRDCSAVTRMVDDFEL